MKPFKLLLKFSCNPPYHPSLPSHFPLLSLLYPFLPSPLSSLTLCFLKKLEEQSLSKSNNFNCKAPVKRIQILSKIEFTFTTFYLDILFITLPLQFHVFLVALRKTQQICIYLL